MIGKEQDLFLAYAVQKLTTSVVNQANLLDKQNMFPSRPCDFQSASHFFQLQFLVLDLSIHKREPVMLLWRYVLRKIYI